MRQRTEKIRYERKFWLPQGSVGEAITILRTHPVMFQPSYEPRQVNNIYFDTFSLSDRAEHAASLGQRQKVRIRWYGHSERAIHPCLEIKHRQGDVGYKEEYPLVDFIPADFTNGDLSAKWLSNQQLPLKLRRWLMLRRPVLFNSYQREYWRSLLGNFRITIDSEIKSWLINNGFYPSLQGSLVSGVIVELKYDKQHQLSALDQVGKYWPWRPVRFSKYIVGLEQLLP